jgi:micrococcal nuclease
VAIGLVASLAALGGGCARSGAPALPDGANATVVRVVDGDTIVVAVGGREEKVRLIGVDTPETVDPRRPVGCFGPQASHHTKQLLPSGAAVQLERDAEQRDRYGRLLAYVHRRPDGLFVNQELLADGYGVTLSIAPNTTFAGRFASIERSARQAGRGLWSACPHQ